MTNKLAKILVPLTLLGFSASSCGNKEKGKVFGEDYNNFMIESRDISRELMVPIEQGINYCISDGSKNKDSLIAKIDSLSKLVPSPKDLAKKYNLDTDFEIWKDYKNRHMKYDSAMNVYQKKIKNN